MNPVTARKQPPAAFSSRPLRFGPPRPAIRNTLAELADFASGEFQHSTLQLWYPGPDTEEHLYRGSANHGLSANPITIGRTSNDMLAPIKFECARSDAFPSLSVLNFGLWPMLASAEPSTSFSGAAAPMAASVVTADRRFRRLFLLVVFVWD